MAKLNRTIGGPREMLIGLCVVTAAGYWYFTRDDASPSSGATQSVPVQFDPGKPAVTREGAVSCPAAILLDKRQGHSLQDATTALVGGLTGPDNQSLLAMGCTTWHAGIPVALASGQLRDRTWLMSTDGLTLYASSWLRN